MTRIIAITGGSGAGKSVIARALGVRLAAQVIAEDDYYRCASTFSDFDPLTHNFDAPEAKEHELLAAHLALAKAGAGFDKPIYDLQTHRRRPESESIPAANTLIVEGLHLLVSPGLRPLFDLKVYVEADEAVRLARRMLRDAETRARAPHTIAAQFFANVRPMHDIHVAPQRALADLVVHSAFDSGPDHAQANAEKIAARLSQ